MVPVVPNVLYLNFLLRETSGTASVWKDRMQVKGSFYRNVFVNRESNFHFVKISCLS